MVYSLFLFFLLLITCSKGKDNKRKLQGRDIQVTESNEYSNIRIYVNYRCLVGSLNTTDTNLIISAIDNAKRTLEKLIKVKRLNKGLYLPDVESHLTSPYETCTGRLNTHEDADLFIYIREASTINNENLNYATPEIYYHLNNDIKKRPLIGGVIYGFILSKLKDNDSKYQALSTIFLHEFTHILGFNKTIMNTLHLISNETSKRRMNNDDYYKASFIGKNALNQAKLYFNCSEMTGIELDAINGEESTDNGNTIHWSERILLGDYMIPSFYYVEQSISEITLASLVDLGYYEVNYYTGGLMRFGKNKNCTFLSRDCIELVNNNILTSFPNEFCSNAYQGVYTFGTCSSGRQSMAYCDNLYPYFNIKSYYNKYRRDGNEFALYGYFGFSSEEEIEFCPYSNSDDININNQNNYDGYCKFGNGKYGAKYGFLEQKTYTEISQYIYENYSENSFCAFSSILKKGIDNPNYINGTLRPTCYKMNCSEKSLTINIADEYIVCPRKGGPILIKSDYSKYEGYIICPDYNLICTGTKMCNDLFDCAKKESLYKNSTFYYDYPYYPTNNISIEIKNRTASSLQNEIVNDELYELGENGTCPHFCQICNSSGQCAVCKPNYVYIGTAEGDNEVIICNETGPEKGYYDFTENEKHFYFKCIENCNKCEKITKDQCIQCVPTHFVNNDKKCEERIRGCIEYDTTKTIIAENNGNAPSYNECLNCNNTDNYYCFDMKREKCEHSPNINLSLYVSMEDKDYPCIQKCDERFMNCETCNRDSCIICNQTNHFINHFGNCIPEIEHCQLHDIYLNYSSCEICDEKNNYYCINETRSVCESISQEEITSYFKITDNENSCVQFCKVKYTDLCLKCTNTGCTKCQEGYFIHNGQCIENITGCINNSVIGTDPNQKECYECDKKQKYYCINETKTECNLMEEADISAYYLIPDIDYPCYGLCGSIFNYCKECNITNCFSCFFPYAINRLRTQCMVPPEFFKEDVKCEINMKNLDSINKDYNFTSAVNEYFTELNHISKVDHFVGKDFTITFYINSNCTDGLLQKGYYSIDTRELNKTIIEESNYDFNFHLLGIYINYNYRSYLSFYDLERKKVDTDKNCPTSKEVNYIMTHNLYNILNEVIGTPFTELVFERALNMFDKNDDIYTDRCTNFSLFKIDIPIHLRKNYLLIDEFINPLLCRDMDCELIEFNMTNRTTICQCPLQTNFNYLFQTNDIKFTLYSETEEPKGIAEAAKAITCMRKGIKYSNFKNNDAAIVILIFFIIQIACYVGYGCFGKPLVNVSNLPTTIPLANPPKLEDNFKIYLFADWNMNLSNSTEKEEPQDEEEKVIQPRDDSDDQIMEEEKSLNNDFFSDNNISIDTNAGGLFQEGRTNRSLRALEKSKKVMILLGNRLKKNKKVSVEQSINQNEIISDDDEPLSEKEKEGSGKFLKNYWLFLSIKQHIINYFSEITCCKITISYVPLELRFVRSIFLFILSIVITILWLDQKYFEKKWEHFNDNYSLSSTFQKNFEISLVERISYALVNNIGNSIVNLIFLIVGDFIVGAIFFNLRNDVQKLVKKNKVNKVDKMQDYLLKVRRNYNIFYVLNFILIIVFFLSLCGFGVIYPGGIADCLTVAIFSIFLLEIVPFIWALILATFRYFGYKKKKQALISFSEFFLF